VAAQPDPYLKNHDGERKGKEKGETKSEKSLSYYQLQRPASALRYRKKKKKDTAIRGSKGEHLLLHQTVRGEEEMEEKEKERGGGGWILVVFSFPIPAGEMQWRKRKARKGKGRVSTTAKMS